MNPRSSGGSDDDGWKRVDRLIITGPSGHRRYRMKQGDYAHGIGWCQPGEIYQADPTRPGHLLVFAPRDADTPRSVELPEAWFEEVTPEGSAGSRGQ